MDPLYPEVMPDRADRVEWSRYLKYWVPRLSAREVREHREVLKERRGLLDSGVDFLLVEFINDQIRRHDWDERSERGRGWREWSDNVLSIDVNLRPGGRAVLRRRRDSYRVEIQWENVGRNDRGKPVLALKSVHVIADEGLGARQLPDLGEFLAAFFLRAVQGRAPAFARAPRRRPGAGQPLDTPFYRQLLDLEEELKLQGYSNPAAEIARRMDENRATVRSWLRRGRAYLPDKKEEQQ